jgi:hypothetical protein
MDDADNLAGSLAVENKISTMREQSQVEPTMTKDLAEFWHHLRVLTAGCRPVTEMFRPEHKNERLDVSFTEGNLVWSRTPLARPATRPLSQAVAVDSSVPAAESQRFRAKQS